MSLLSVSSTLELRRAEVDAASMADDTRGHRSVAPRTGGEEREILTLQFASILLLLINHDLNVMMLPMLQPKRPQVTLAHDLPLLNKRTRANGCTGPYLWPQSPKPAVKLETHVSD